MRAGNEKRGNPSPLLRVFDACAGVFGELFDPRMLTPAVTLLMAYTTLFTQRKFPGRWMEFIFIGLLFLALVTLTARTPGLRRRLRWHPGMTALWFSLHGFMLLSGFFYEDWLPDAVTLLVAYPFVFAVFSAREDQGTFRAVLNGAVFGILPFILWSYITKPIVLGYPGYYGVFYNANGLAMCSMVMTICALLLCQAQFVKGQKKGAVFYAIIALVGFVTLFLTLSRSAWGACVGTIVILLAAFAYRYARHPGRVLALLCVVVIAAGGVMAYVSYQKAYENMMTLYENALDTQRYYPDMDISAYDPALGVRLEHFSSDRLDIWRAAMSNLTWNGHPSGVIEEWAVVDGGDRRLNAHNSFVAVFYNNGWPAGVLFIAYVLLSLWRAIGYYRRHAKSDPYAITPLAVCAMFIMESLFESIYSPFSVVGCLYLLVQGVLWRDESARAQPEGVLADIEEAVPPEAIEPASGVEAGDA